MAENTDQSGPPVVLALRPKQAAAALNIGTRKLWVLTNQGRIPHLKLDGCVLYPTDLLRQWLADQAVKP